MRTPLALLAMLMAAAVVQGQQPCASVPTISVSGTSAVRLRPDRVSFSAGVETDAKTVAEAFAKNSAKLNSVVRALKMHGVTPPEIQTSNFSLTSRDEEGKKLPGFRVNNTVTVTRPETSNVSELLQAAVDAGATEAGSIRFFVADPKKPQTEGLESAFGDAKRKAEKPAQLSGRSLGPVISVSDQSFGGYFSPSPSSVPKPAFESVTVTAEAPAIETGVQDLTFAVSVVFALQ